MLTISKTAQTKNGYKGKKIKMYDLKKTVYLKYMASYKVIYVVASTNSLMIKTSAVPHYIWLC